MTKGEAIELVLQRVSGGTVNQDTSRRIRYEDVATYLTPAINYAITKQYYITKREEGESTVSDEFVATYYQPVLFDAQRDAYYSDLPAKLISMPKNRGIRYVGAIKGDNQFVEASLTATKHDSYYTGSTANETIYRLVGSKLYYSNISGTVKEVIIQMIANINDLDDEDELPVPSGTEIEVIDLCIQFFTGQRQMPQDVTNNNVDG